MIAEIEHAADPPSEAAIKKSKDKHVSWKYKAVDGIYSAVECLQLFLWQITSVFESWFASF